ncbi:MAG TPA: DUF4034 domain-containing protein [Chitinolyticbacter sp.]|nr:DUF4034 domain-containing protein [Chitinolyticbacter sp.]
MTITETHLAADRPALAFPYQPVLPEPRDHKLHVQARQLLLAREFQQLDALLRAAGEAVTESRDAEGDYSAAMAYVAAHVLTPATLELLREWQQARPESGHAWLCESIYWYDCAYRYRGTDVADAVGELDWLAAHACVDNQALAAMRALERDPTLWLAAEYMQYGVGAFTQPRWVDQLLADTPPPAEYRYALPDDPGARAALVVLFATAGLHPDEVLRLPVQRPAALPRPTKADQQWGEAGYWARAALSIQPRLFFVLRGCLRFLQPRWGGSHNQMRAFIASSLCEHLGPVEQDRLVHEIWRDDLLDCDADPELPGYAFEKLVARCRTRIAESLFPYHRQEVQLWLMRNYLAREQYEEAMLAARAAVAEAPIDNEAAFWPLQQLAIRFDDYPWFVSAVIASAEREYVGESRALYAYFAHSGRHGFVQDEAIALAWCEQVWQEEEFKGAWSEVAMPLIEAERFVEAVELLQLGDRVPNTWCAVLLGNRYRYGQGVAQDWTRAEQYFQRAIAEGECAGAVNLSGMHGARAAEATTPQQREHWEYSQIIALQQALDLGAPEDEHLDSLLMLVPQARSGTIRRRFLPMVRQHADEGHPLAMMVLAAIYGNKAEPEFYNLREGTRWLMGAEAVAPEHSYLEFVTDEIYTQRFWHHLRYLLTRNGIQPHEVPGADARAV